MYVILYIIYYRAKNNIDISLYLYIKIKIKIFN